MKICHMTSAHSSDDVRILKKQCVSLAKDKSNTVFLVAPGHSYQYKDVQIIGVGEHKGGRLSRILKISREVYNKALSVDADIYEFHDPELLLYAKKLSRHGKKVIFDSHEDYRSQILEKRYIPKLLRKIVKNIYVVIENHACKYLDAVLFPEAASPYEGRVKHCVPIYNTPIFDEFEHKKSFEEKENSVCCIGSLSEDRGIRVLMEACYKAGVKLVLGGNFSPAVFGEELKKQKEYGIVDFQGYCTREKVNDIYNRCLIGADTILDFGQYAQAKTLSTKVYEYMVMKMPYITSDFEYNKEIINQYKCGVYVDPMDSDAIAEKIKYLLENKQIAKEMGENGRKAAETCFSWNNDESRLIALYKRLYQEKNSKKS